ncbi:MAG TPA: baseplate J/gp47 family protein [Chitinophaga sp.]|uniref:baseplate J/gp47 family protein n=1 Tax=Chitinophaga sp. TaxID=1869181 RepID=UPI002C485B78|nr:baseplate J/gp47 family protein [Chitinophaga sp.]HVI44762.1 baseplate J/gp47 family protein [Chitinophaga sp.]
MNATNNISGNLVRDGVSQLQRKIAALATEELKVDERSTAQLLGFLYRYARYVLYYDDSIYSPFQKADTLLTTRGDWQDFFRHNPPFQYAAVQQLDISAFDTAYHQARSNFSRQQPEDQFWSLFSRIMDMVLQLNSWQSQIDTSTGLQGMLTALVRTDFSKALYRLIAMANTFSPLPDEAVNNIAILRQNENWQLTMDKLIAKDALLVRLKNYPRRKREKMLAQLDELFSIFYKGLQQAQAFALSDFDKVLTGEQKHQPHVGLLYAFLRLFDLVRGKMNTITDQHLKFFYEEVLQLKKRPLQPDHAHIVTELAKQLPDYLLKDNTSLKAGKDATGKEVVFKTEESVVLNKAKVNQLRTLFRDNKANLYVAPVAASADGLGEAFRNPATGSWPVLGTGDHISKNSPDPVATHFPFATTGLLMASSVLLLNEGSREVIVMIKLQKGDDSLQSELTKTYYLLNNDILAAFEKAGIDKEKVGNIRKKMKNDDVKEKWLNDDKTGPQSFIAYTGIDTLLDVAKSIAGKKLLQIDYTTADGWKSAPQPELELSGTDLKISFKLAADAPAVATPPADIIGAVYPVNAPLLRILFNHSLHYHIGETDKPLYETLSHLVIKESRITVKVENVRKLFISNDEGALDPSNKFLPFTGVPKIGSNLFIGSDEVFRKKLGKLELHWEWEGLPPKNDFGEYYKAYEQAGIINEAFTVRINALKNGKWPDRAEGDKLRLFREINNTNPLIDLDIPTADIPVVTQPSPLAPYNNTSLYGFIRLSLDRDFLHNQYAAVLGRQLLKIGKANLDDIKARIVVLDSQAGNTKNQTALTKSAADGITPDSSGDSFQDLRNKANNADTNAQIAYTSADVLNAIVEQQLPGSADIPNPPYTPTIKSFSLSYEATADDKDITLLHQYPYEIGNYKQLSSADDLHLMPVYDAEGTLYIGLEQAIAGSNINLLFQLSEFTADPDIRPADVKWSYLTGNEWKPLEKNTQLISDNTQGLLTSGIVTIALPWDADTAHTVLPSGLHWLRISAGRYTTAVCEAIAVMAQAARVVFVNNNNDPSRVVPGLPPQTINGLVVPDAAVSKVLQPYVSFGGRREETAEEFRIRVSERLRHKGRAINVFDYEHIILDAFPEIFKIKCIPHSKMCRDEKANIAQLLSPGWVTLAVIPRIDDFPADEKSNPKVSRIILEKVSQYLAPRTSAFAKVQVINPVYQPVDFKGNIRFKEGLDVNFYGKKLIREVQAFMSPWINTGSQDIVFGGTLMMSSVLQFVEQRDYIDFVTEFTMFTNKDGTNGPPVMAVTADTPWSVLVAGRQDYISITACNSNVSQPPFQIR